MKLAFNVVNSGLGNNGGSRTILLCQKALEELGHTCYIIGTADNFTWFEHKPIISYLPRDLDAIIATACTTVDSTLGSNVPKKAWYIRGHESWANTEDQLQRYYNAGLFNIVNSTGLKNKLKSYGADSKVVHQGIEFDLWEDKELRKKDKIRIGCLYNKKPTKRWEDFVKLAEILGTDDYEYLGMGDTMRNDSFLIYFKANANIYELNNIYSSCHIWFAPTELEGMHNVPMEAALCGCLIVCSDHPMNGMVDYSFNKKTTMVYQSRNIEQAAELMCNPNWNLAHKLQIFIKDEIGDRKENMKKIVKYLESL